MKWAALVRSEIQQNRNRVFSKYLQEQGVENTLTIDGLDKGNFKTQIDSIIKENDIVRISNSFGRELLTYFDNQTPQVMTLGSADTLVKQGKKIFLRSAQYHCCLDIFKRQKFVVDIKKAGLVVGTGALARYACAALVQIGVKKINITNSVEEGSDEFIKSIKKFNFDIEVEFISKNRLLLEPGTHGLIINTIAHNEETSELFEELRYFNYLAENSVVWDVVLTPERTDLIDEAERMNFNIVDGAQFCAETDIIWASWKLDKKLSLDAYESFLRKEINL